jgi:hypothetical protein
MLNHFLLDIALEIYLFLDYFCQGCDLSVVKYLFIRFVLFRAVTYNIPIHDADIYILTIDYAASHQ